MTDKVEFDTKDITEALVIEIEQSASELLLQTLEDSRTFNIPLSLNEYILVALVNLNTSLRNLESNNFELEILITNIEEFIEDKYTAPNLSSTQLLADTQMNIVSTLVQLSKDNKADESLEEVVKSFINEYVGLNKCAGIDFEGVNIDIENKNTQYRFPGITALKNVKELKNKLFERCSTFSESLILDEIPANLRAHYIMFRGIVNTLPSIDEGNLIPFFIQVTEFLKVQKKELQPHIQDRIDAFAREFEVFGQRYVSLVGEL